MHKSHRFFVCSIIRSQISIGIESKIFLIATFNSFTSLGSKIFNIPLTIDQISSIGERSGELGGYLGIVFPLSIGPSSQVGINLVPKSF